MIEESTQIASFERHLRQQHNPVDFVQDGIIGKGVEIETAFGRKPLIYADYVASGRALEPVEKFIATQVLPFYANSHTEQSFCGAKMTQLRAEARAVIAQKCNAPKEDYAVIFGGSGATTGLNQLVHLFEVTKQDTTVFVGPYEHHSNLLPWRESGAKIVTVAEAADGGVDLVDLEAKLRQAPRSAQIIGAFSAASNVTGICTDIIAVTRLVQGFGGKVIWDYAGGAPYLPIDMQKEGVSLDAVVFSPHKFIGGPGASGVLIVRRDVVSAESPARPGGGTVVFVNQHKHDYVASLEQREEGGTPNVIGDIRAALALVVKDVIGQRFIDQRNASLTRRIFAAWSDHRHIRILAAQHQQRLPIASFTVDHESFDYQDFTKALSDHFGIQARGGCSCAGPYVHELMSISEEQSENLRTELLRSDDANKPGFVRLNLSYLMSDTEIEQILSSVPLLAEFFCEDHEKQLGVNQ